MKKVKNKMLQKKGFEKMLGHGVEVEWKRGLGFSKRGGWQDSMG